MAAQTTTESLLDDLDDLSDVGVDDDEYDDDDNNDDENDAQANNKNDAVKNDDHDLNDNDGTNNSNNNNGKEVGQNSDRNNGMDIERGDDENTIRTVNDNNNNNDFLAPRYLQDRILQNHLQSIRSSSTTTNNNNTNKNEQNQQQQQHKLIVQSNKQIVQLTNELQRVYSILCFTYKVKFPELEELIVNPIQYTRAVRIIGNEMDMTRVTDALSKLVTSNQIITISVAGSTTNGRPLTELELHRIYQLINYIEEINTIQEEIIVFVENHMTMLAPNVCALVGSSVAAKLIGLAGGISELAKIPACNIQVLGQTKYNTLNRAGLSSATIQPHQGILVECDLIQTSPRIYQPKLLKLVASKVALAARYDATAVETGQQQQQQTLVAHYGYQYRTEIQNKLQKLQEPDKAQVIKALPKPDLMVKKRRGGKRMRRLKERYEETSMMKQANTRAFSTQTGEYGDDAMGLTLGLLDTTAEITAGGSLRKNVGEKKKMKYANTRATRKQAQQQQAQQQRFASSSLSDTTTTFAATTTASRAGASGSSMIFTSGDGMQLLNPETKKQKMNSSASSSHPNKWFGDNITFQSSTTNNNK